jgi:hypothetical protein
VEPDGGRPVTLRVPARLDTMRLGPGDVLHVRAVALDENDVTGPDSGFSETRTIRIDDPRTRDTLRITPSAALPLDTTTLSQRMLIIEAESLLARRPRLDAGVYGRGARGLGQRQGRLRMRVEELLSTPEIRDISADLEQHTAEGSIAEASVASLLRDASRAMIDAESDLLRVRVAEALPHMRRALRFLDRARASGRLYLRGILPLSAVDLPKVRLKGEDPASVGARDPRPPVSDARRALLTRLERALPLRPLARRAFLDSLTLVRAAALSLAPDVAEPLGEAIDRVRQGSDPSAALSTVRRRLRRDTQASPALSGWRGVP